MVPTTRPAWRIEASRTDPPNDEDEPDKVGGLDGEKCGNEPRPEVGGELAESDTIRWNRA